jgi:taurine dioxygenase
MTDCVETPWLEPITPSLGATMGGIHLDPEMPETVVARIRAAMAEHLVLVLPDQDLDAAMLRGVAARFGPLFRHHADEGVLHADGLPEVLEMRKEPDGQRLFGGGDWHADITFRKPAGHLSILHAKILPPAGGDTGFASTIAAFEALSEGMRDMLRGLTAVHSYDGPGRPDHPTETAVHPVVRRHPDTGREGLYLNRMFATRFDGMTEAESRPLIDFLDRHMSRPEFSCRVRWRQGQVTIWDNRFTLHYPINDFTGHRRLLLRCSTLEA